MKRWKVAIIVMFCSSILMCVIYWDVVTHLNRTLFSVDGDGLLNYFSFLYHIKHDMAYGTFEGMHYPYGELIYLTDCHPLLATSIKFISTHLVDVSPYAVGILNGLMLGAVVVCSLFVYLILDHFRLKWYIAGLAAIAISFSMSSVLLWQYGHYALSYPCFFPIGWYLLLKYECSEKKLKYSLFIMLNILFWFYTHIYLGLILAAFTALYHVFIYISTKNISWKTVAFFAIHVLIPIAIVYTSVTFMDTHEGRIEMPYDHKLKASIYTVFMPNYSFLRPIYDFFFDLSKQEQEQWSPKGNYIGLSANIAILTFIFYVVYFRIVHKKWLFNQLLHKRIWPYVFASVLLLLFAMAFPFRFGLEFLLPGLLKQFVGLGRFAWAFYFVITVASFLLFANLFKTGKLKWLQLLMTVLLFAEGLSYHIHLRKEIAGKANVFHQEQSLPSAENLISTFDFSPYQAVLSIPFYHEYISLHTYRSSDKAEMLSMQLSYKTGLPLMNAIQARPSVLESQKIIQLLAPTYYDKPIEKDLNEQPLLIIYSKDTISANEKALLSKAEKVYENDAFELYELNLEDVFDTNHDHLVEEFLHNREALFYQSDNELYASEDKPVIYDSFDDETADKQYRGGGALQFPKQQESVIFETEPGALQPSATYLMSFWYYNYIYEQSWTTARIELLDRDHKVLDVEYFDPIKTNIYDQHWAFNEQSITIPAEDEVVLRLVMSGAHFYGDTIYIDELLIRPEGVNVYMKTEDKDLIIKNNEPIKTSKPVDKYSSMK